MDLWTAPLIALALALALALRPWRQLAHEALWTPLLAALVLLPWLWALPRLQAMPLQLQFSGAVLLMLSLGWPLAVWALLAVSVLADLLAPQALGAQAQRLLEGGPPHQKGEVVGRGGSGQARGLLQKILCQVSVAAHKVDADAGYAAANSLRPFRRQL